MEKKHILNSRRVLEDKNARQKKRKKTFFIFLCYFLVIFFVSVALSRYEKFRIVNIEIKGNSVIDSDDILKNISTSIGGYHFFVFPKNNIALIPENEIIKNLENEFSRLTDIKVELKTGNILFVSMLERTGSYIWCGENFVTGISLADTKCYFTDKIGFVFDEAPYFAGDVYFRFFGILSEKGKTNGYFAKENFNNYILLKNEIENMNLRPIALLHKDNGETEFYLKHTNEIPNTPKIIFNQKDDIKKTVENLKSALNAEPLKTDIVKKYEKLLYIDLRFGNKVYFKFSE